MSSPPDGAAIVKECACGRLISRISWDALPFMGTCDNGRDRGELLEMRNCTCGSTLTLPIGEHAPSSPQFNED